MKLILWLSKTLSPNYFALAKKQQSIQMVTICFSHYCELAMWALQKGNKSVVEHAYAPGQHVLPAMRIRLFGENGKKKFSSSSRMIGAKEREAIENAGGVDKLSEEERKKYRKRDASARATAVPVAALPNGDVLLDSWEIAEYSGLEKAPEELKILLDNELGPQARQAAYSIILKKENIPYFHKLCTINRSWVIQLIWKLYLGNYILNYMIKLFSPYDTAAVNKCKDSLANTFEKLDRIVSERKAAPILLPPLYCEGKYNAAFQGIYNNDIEAKNEVDRWRNTITGRYVMELYATQRLNK